MKKSREVRFFATVLVVMMMVLAFTVPASAATLPNSYYSSSGNLVAVRFAITSGTNEYLNGYGNSITDQMQVSTWAKTNDNTQKFVIYRASDGITTIRPYSEILYSLCSSANNCIIRYIPNVTNTNYIQIQDPINSETTSPGYYAWRINVFSGGALTATTTATASPGGYKVAWQNFVSRNLRQIWHVMYW